MVLIMIISLKGFYSVSTINLGNLKPDGYNVQFKRKGRLIMEISTARTQATADFR